jgi:hypothetical protein
MAFREEIREGRKYKTKKSIDSLAQQLAEIIFPDCEARIDDLLERFITFEAGRYNLLPENEMKILIERKDYQDYIGSKIQGINPPTPIAVKPQAPRQEIKTLLPLGAVRTD